MFWFNYKAIQAALILGMCHFVVEFSFMLFEIWMQKYRNAMLYVLAAAEFI